MGTADTPESLKGRVNPADPQSAHRLRVRAAPRRRSLKLLSGAFELALLNVAVSRRPIICGSPPRNLAARMGLGHTCLTRRGLAGARVDGGASLRGGRCAAGSGLPPVRPRQPPVRLGVVGSDREDLAIGVIGAILASARNPIAGLTEQRCDRRGRSEAAGGPHQPGSGRLQLTRFGRELPGYSLSLPLRRRRLCRRSSR